MRDVYVLTALAEVVVRHFAAQHTALDLDAFTAALVGVIQALQAGTVPRATPPFCTHEALRNHLDKLLQACYAVAK